MKLQNMYIEALESLGQLANLKPGRCELSTVVRAERKKQLLKIITRFIKAKVKTGSEWEKKQDDVLNELGNHS